MKRLILLIFLISSASLFQNCTVQTNGKWKSKHNNLELNFGKKWEQIVPSIDSKKKVVVGIQDPSDHSSVIIKITDDVSKDLLTDDLYFESIKIQMMEANSNNEFLLEDTIQFKSKLFRRMIFKMDTKYGDLIQVAYALRDGVNVTSIQIAYPKNLIENPSEEMPKKIEKVLKNLKL